MNLLRCSSHLSLCSRANATVSLISPRLALSLALRSASTAPNTSSPTLLPKEGPVLDPKLRYDSTLARLIPSWSASKPVHQRLRSFGVAERDLKPLLDLFTARIRDGSVWHSMAHDPRQCHQLLQLDGRMRSYDRFFNQLLYSWVSDNASDPALAAAVSEESLFRIVSVARELDYCRFAHRFTDARRIRRKVIMHVGPTNSGKTHNALSALAAARSGQYMGPLRLLAYEIYSRLNAGQIVPLGADPSSDPHPEPDEQTNLDGAPLLENGKHARSSIRVLGDARYARKCDLITGEERRTVSEARLSACTIEMADLRRLMDVAVIDEIQMIADPDRGHAWTSAVVGVCAREVHLCGEESAVPLVQALLRDTGDDLVVNRYQRLSPLRVAEEPLGDLSNVQKGDCVVAFSRARIFATKAEIERRTKLRCAVAYGRLPPEVRSEQAALFNAPDSGYDVLVGSDALGMGLNLKIRRVVFTEVFKFNPALERPDQLSESAIKQIGGRAGRFGLHTDSDSDVGVVTTVTKEDLPIVKAAFESDITPLTHAYVDFIDGIDSGRRIDVLRSPSAAHGDSRSGTTHKASLAAVDEVVSRLTTRERRSALDIPVPHNDEEAHSIILELIREWSGQKGHVNIARANSMADLLQALNEVAKAQQTGSPVERPKEALTQLEMLHKILVAYAWAFWKWPAAFYAHNTVMKLLRAGEQGMGYVLRSWKHYSTPRKPWRNQRAKMGTLRGEVQRRKRAKAGKAERKTPDWENLLEIVQSN